MTFVVVRKLLRDVRLPLAVVLLLLFGFETLWVKITQRAVVQLSPLFATLAARAGIMQKQLEEQIFAGPGKLVQTMAGGENMRFERATDMMSIGFVHPLVISILCIWAVGRAAGAIAGEIDRGTMELLLAQPVPRRLLIFAHFIVDVITIPLLALAIWGGQQFGYWLMGPFTVSAAEAKAQMGNLPFEIKVDPALLHVNPAAFWPALANIVAFAFAVSGVTLAMSATGRFRNRVLGWAIVIALLMFIANVVGQMWDAAGWIRPLSIFYYYQPQAILLSDRWWVAIPGLGRLYFVPALFALGLLGYLFAWLRFERRDLPAPL